MVLIAVVSVGLPGPASALTVRTVNLHDRDTYSLKMARESGAVAAGAFHSDQDHLSQRREPPHGSL